MTDHVHMRPKIIGARIKRTEDPRLLTGNGNFVDDRQVAGVLHIAFLRSNQAHARIGAIDSSKARATRTSRPRRGATFSTNTPSGRLRKGCSTKS